MTTTPSSRVGSRKRPAKDPEGRMSLREHLAELRRRVLISGAAILLGSVAGWYAYPRVFQAVQQPLIDVANASGVRANLNFTNIMQAFNLHLEIAAYLGLILASPVWLYQGWAFVLPGLTKKEKWSAVGFAAAATPLFLAGLTVGWLVMPNAVTFFATFAEPGTSVLPDAGAYLGFVTRLLLVFGIAFLLPLILVSLNLAGLISARTMGRGWRVAVFLIFLFAALASPTAEAGSMLALALPMTALYAIAVGISTMIDRRRERRSAAAALDDNTASPISAPAPLERSFDDAL